MGVPITLVTGFLGSGKTTLINQAVKQSTIPKEEIIIIVNELGEVGIDHKLMIHSKEQIYQLNNGCLCCSLREDLFDTLQSIDKVFTREHRKLEQVIIETTGIADPRTIIQTLEMTTLSQKYYIDSIITVIDCENIEYSFQKFSEVSNQILVADRFVLTKINKSDFELIERIKHQLSAINPIADLVINEAQFFNLKLYNQAPKLIQEVHHHHSHFNSLVLTYDIPLKESLITPWLDWLLYSFKDNLYRFKGLMQIQNKEMAVVLHGVHSHYHFEMSTLLSEKTVTQIVLIGQNLNQSAIYDSFSQLIHASKENYEDANCPNN